VGRPKASTNDYIVMIRHPTNNSLQLDDVTTGSEKRINAKCPQYPDHEWPSSVNNLDKASKRFDPSKVSNPPGCPVCKGHKASVSNSIDMLHPHLSVEVHPFNNGPVSGKMIAQGMNKRKTEWKCNLGPDHEWRQTATKRTSRGHGCPKCTRDASVEVNLLAANPTLSEMWHPHNPMRPNHVRPNSNKRALWKCPNGPDHDWNAPLNNAHGQGLGCPSCGSGDSVSVTNSTLTKSTQFTEQFHPILNYPHSPRDFRYRTSTFETEWKCPNGPDHVWSHTQHTRMDGKKGELGCPFCSSRRPSVGNCLASFPEVVAEIDPFLNPPIRAQEESVTAPLLEQVSWRCPMGPDHVWSTTVNSRTSPPETGCPYCSGIAPSVTNSIVTQNRVALETFHPLSNYNIDGSQIHPTEVAWGSGKKKEWKCEMGPDHEWTQTADSRKSKGCPWCKGDPPFVSCTKSLEVISPALAIQVHPLVNQPSPREVTARSGASIQWKCRYGPHHTWPTEVANRYAGNGCPSCSLPHGRSEIEIRVMSEICHFLDTHWRDCKIPSGKKVDFFFEQTSHGVSNLVVELDPMGTHRNRVDDDRRISNQMRENHRVIRAREAPLEALHPDDIVYNCGSSPRRINIRRITILILRKMENMFSIQIPGLEQYEKSENLVAQEDADEILERWRDIQADRESDKIQRQLADV